MGAQNLKVCFNSVFLDEHFPTRRIKWGGDCKCTIYAKQTYDDNDDDDDDDD